MSCAGACIKTPIPHCVKLLSEDCEGITGDYSNNQAIFLGSLFSTKGSTSNTSTNLPRQQSAALAIEQINAAGGVPDGSTSAHPRPLVMISCDESTNLVRAAKHLVDDLHVPAIVGPNTSQDTIDVSTKVTVPAGTVVISPTGVASSIASLSDNDLTWLMVPSDVQRAPLMINQIGVLETTLRAARNNKQYINLGIVFRNDALGIGTRTALNDLMINGQSLSNAINLGNHVQIDPYTGTDTDQHAIVSKYLTFLPDIIVLAGTGEGINLVMKPLEAAMAGRRRSPAVRADRLEPGARPDRTHHRQRRPAPSRARHGHHAGRRGQGHAGGLGQSDGNPRELQGRL